MKMLIGDNTAKWITLCRGVEALCAWCGNSKRKTKRYMWHFWQARNANDFEAVEKLKERIKRDSLSRFFSEGKPAEPSKDFHPMFDLIVGNLLKKKIAEEEANENADR